MQPLTCKVQPQGVQVQPQVKTAVNMMKTSKSLTTYCIKEDELKIYIKCDIIVIGQQMYNQLYNKKC